MTQEWTGCQTGVYGVISHGQIRQKICWLSADEMGQIVDGRE